MTTQTKFYRSFLAALLVSLGTSLALAQSDVTQPGDPIIASSSNSPGSEGVANAIDNTQAKYLNRDTRNPDNAPSGFVVSPSVGVTRLIGMTIQAANDAIERDPSNVRLEGSNDASVTNFTSGTWTVIKEITTAAFAARFEKQTFFFDNFNAYRHYRWTVLSVATPNGCCMQVAEVELLGSTLPPDVTQPGDPIVASSSNSPGSEGVANAIDNTQAKYLNRDTRNPDNAPSGFVVTPGIGRSLVTGMTIQSANDAIERDPSTVTLEGSNDASVTNFNSGTWTLLTGVTNIPAFTARFQTQTFLFDNYTPYRHYRWTVRAVATPNGCCMQVGEVQLLGTGAPQDVTQPGDPIIASSSNSPGSEGVANAIDNTQAKYLNRDTRNPDNAPSGFVVSPSIGSSVVTGMTIQSANDAIERDPSRVKLEGSNDASVTNFTSGNWTVLTDITTAPFTSRFQTQEFFFANKVSFRHYRWTVISVATPNGCCMQVGEVQLLAATQSNPCGQTQFTEPPVDSPALVGSPAIFSGKVNGPWTVQWLRNGTPIPGATALSYSTPPMTAGGNTNQYALAIVGCQTSQVVRATLFTPSTTKSLAVHFWGNSANGAGPQGNTGPVPNFLSPTDIAGVQPQAYWNVATNGTGLTGDQSTLPDSMTDSDGNASTITFEFATSGTWGAGTGLDTPTERMLNGIAGATAIGTDQIITFHNVPAGTHSVLVYCVNAPLNFHTVSYAIGTQKYYLRVMNTDEYNPAPGFYRGTSTDLTKPSVANFVRFDNVQRDASGDVTLTFAKIATGGQANQTGVNAIQLVLNAPAVGAPPTITQDPSPAFGPTNAVVQLTVQATGNNLTYQWRKSGKNLPNGGHVSGATTATLTISSLSADDVAVYNVAVFNPAGSVVSKNATVNVSKYNINDALAGYWKFDETSGAKAANAATGGIAGDVSGTATWGAGQVGNALSFDGSSTYVVVTNYPKAAKALSVAGWVNVPAASGTSMAFIRNAQGGIGVSVAQNGAPASQFELGLNDDGSGALFLSAGIVAGPNVSSITAPTAFTLGSWQHVALTADGAQLRLYVNGIEVASQPYLGDFIIPEVKELSMGARLNADNTLTPPVIGLDTTPNNLAGRMDDFGLWNRVVAPDEINKVYTAGKAGNPLSSVIVTPPAAAPRITSITLTGGNIRLEWTGGGTLEAAASVTGPWQAVPGATSPFTLAPSAAAQFGRIRVP